MTKIIISKQNILIKILNKFPGYQCMKNFKEVKLIKKKSTVDLIALKKKENLMK